VEALLADHTPVTLDADNAGRFLSGVRRRGPGLMRAGGRVRANRALLGTAHVAGGELIPGRLLSPLKYSNFLKSSPQPCARGIRKEP
jgi:tRNA pseudouridine55 synthase